MKKILITGATGFIGYHLLRELREKGIEIWALCRPENKDIDQIKKLNRVHVVACELEQIWQLPELCMEREFDVFYHLAWKGASGSSRGSYRIQLDNIQWTCDCVEIAQKMKCRKMIITGTVCEKQGDAILKQRIPTASAYYLLSKKYASEMAGIVGSRIGISVLCCRFYHPIGIFNKKEQIIANTIQKLRRNEEPHYGLAEELFDVIDVRDLSHALYLMGERELIEDSYFVGSGNPRVLKEYLETVKDIVRPSAHMWYGAIDTYDLPMEREWLNTLPFQAETGFAPVYTFSESIREMQSWMEDEKTYDSEKWHI